MATDDETPRLTPYERAEIQMELLVPVLRRLQSQLGAEAVLDALRAGLDERIAEAAAQYEAEYEAEGEPPAMARMVPGFARWAEGGALEYEVVADDEELVGVDVTACRYAALMDRLDARDLGQILICGPDHVGAARRGLRLDRPNTHMTGDGVCDFRFTPVELGPKPSS